MSENLKVENAVIDIDVEESKKLGWELGKASEGKLPGDSGVDLAEFVRPNVGWIPGNAGASLAYGAGGLGREGDFEGAKSITEKLLKAAEQERLAREGK